MAKKQTASSNKSFEPLQAVLFVSGEGTSEIPVESLTSKLIDEKAFGLSCLPKPWSLPFVVVSDELMSLYSSCSEKDRKQLLKNWAVEIIKAASVVGIQVDDSIIVRSSGCSEGLEERGKYYSREGTLENIQQSIEVCLQKLVSDKDLDRRGIPLIIQKYATPISAKGHLSNERRFYKENRDWLGDIGDIADIKTGRSKEFKVNIRNWRKDWRKVIADKADKPLECDLTVRVSEILKIPAAWGYARGLRLHFEWVCDGKVIYIVQADQERESDGVDPTKICPLSLSVPLEFVPKCLRKISKADEARYKNYEKIRNVFTYSKLNLPTRKLYVLDNKAVIDDLALGQASTELEDDLAEMIKGSLVIRMDIATEDKKRRQLLPRTHEVRELDSALQWLMEKSVTIKNNKEIKEDFVFIFHNFLPAVASAFAYAEPGARKVLIEALWGLPEGLYYNRHDKYIVDTKNPHGKELCFDDIGGFEVKSMLYFKQFFVAPDKNGYWITQALKPSFNWRGSIQRKAWAKEIALESRRIAEEEGKPLSIMWFVNVKGERGGRPVIPWYHETYDPRNTNLAPTHRTKSLFDKSLMIKTTSDIEKLRQEAEKGRSRVRLVRIQPREEALLRDKNTLRMIGDLTQKIDAIILMEGGVLSHAYYQLIQTNAIVEVLHPFKDVEDKREFYKLVRDKVPSNIEGGGEVVSCARLSGEYLLKALREKLVEEAFEALDAIEQDSFIGELADVNEVIDGILSELHVNRNMLQKRQEQKKNKAGGFKEGLVLLDTKNPLPIKKNAAADDSLFGNISNVDSRHGIVIEGQELVKLGHAISKKWSDRREHMEATETILNLVIPMIKDSWTEVTPKTIIGSDSGKAIQARITGERLGAKLKIDLFIFVPKEKESEKQLKLFDESSKSEKKK